MKKSKLKMGLVTSFICGMALTACNDVTANDKNVVTYKDYSGSEIGLLTDNMYSEDLETSAGLTKYYEKVRDLLVRATFEKVTGDSTSGLKVKTSYKTLVAQAKNKVEEQKETARKNAKNNDTSYADEMDAIYESHNCEDEEGLYQHFLLDLEKEQLDSAIMDNDAQLKILRDGNGAEEKGWIKSAKPYHIKHMLVKIDVGADNFTRATITKDEAKKLSDMITKLANGEQFDDLASKNMLSDDSTDKLGDVGIVNNNATTKSLKMVSEFQLGIYAGDYMINHNSSDDIDGIGLDSKVDIDGEGEKEVKAIFADPNYKMSVGKVPYEIFTALGTYGEYPKEDEKEDIRNVNASVYPRNVIWNKYLNNHSVFVIVNKQADTTSTTNLSTDTPDANAASLNLDVANKKSGFNADGYLCAEDGKVIFGVRSEYGVHFIKIQKSAYDNDLSTYYPISLKENDVDVTAQAVGSNYIVGLDNAKDTYDTRLGDIKSAIKSYDSNSEYRLYNFLVSYAKANDVLKTDNEATNKILSKIDAHITDLKESETYKQAEGLKSVWENYLRLVHLQNTKRSEQYEGGYFVDSYSGGVHTKEWQPKTFDALVTEAAAQEFISLCDAPTDADEATHLSKFVEGGEYYYGK